MATALRGMDTETLLNHLWRCNLKIAPFSSTLLAKHMINPTKYPLSVPAFHDALQLDMLYGLDVYLTDERKTAILLDNQTLFETLGAL